MGLTLDSDRFREIVHIQYNQFSFMPGKSTMDAIFILRQVQEKVFEGNSRRLNLCGPGKGILLCSEGGSLLEPAEKGNIR